MYIHICLRINTQISTIRKLVDGTVYYSVIIDELFILYKCTNNFFFQSNDKLELTEKLSTAEYQIKETTEKLHQTEQQLHTLAEAIEIKDRELTLIREGSTELSKQIYQQNQLTDRLRHYEAQEHTLAALQNELKDSQKLIEELTKENVYLKQHLQSHSHSQPSLCNSVHAHDEVSNENENSSVENTFSEDTSSNNTLLIENEDLKRKIETLEKSNDELVKKINNLNINQVNQTDLDKENLANSTLDKEAAMKQLEEKFTKTMQDIANLQDEKQRLEHVVLQLQGETETIGEYIALYQHQRAVLSQRALEKENQLKKLSLDREQMRFKIDQLNSLVRKLIRGKGPLPPELIEQHNQINSSHNETCLNDHGDHRDHVSNENVENSLKNEVVENETAEKIIALLSEMKSSSLVQPSDVTENFHPCPCCSGHLLNV